MKYLLDTHTLIWHFLGLPQISPKAENIIINSDDDMFVSVVSLWEFSIKYGMGKLKFEGGLDRLWELITDNGFIVLPISKPHLSVFIELPFIHKDPFDRLLVAVAKADNLTFLTADENIHLYDISCEW